MTRKLEVQKYTLSSYSCELAFVHSYLSRIFCSTNAKLNAERNLKMQIQTCTIINMATIDYHEVFSKLEH